MSLSRTAALIGHRLDSHMIEVVRGTSVALGMKVLAVGLGFGLNVLLARLLGAEGAGVYYLALTVTSIAAVVGRIGLDNALLRHVAASAGTDDWAAVKGVAQIGVALALGASLIFALMVFLLAPWLADRVFTKPELAEPLRWMSLAIVPMALCTLLAQMLKGLKRIFQSQLLHVIVPSLACLGLVILGPVWGVLGAVSAFASAAVVAALTGLWFWQRETRQLRALTGQFRITRLLSSSVPLFWVALMGMLMNRTSTIILGIFATNEDVAVYHVAWRTASLTSIILVAANSIVAPKFAALYAQKDMVALGRLARHSAALMTLCAAPILVIFVVWPGLVLSIFGSEFITATTVLSILALGQFVNVSTGSVGQLLMMSGHEKLMRNSVACTALLNVMLNALLIPRFGIVGAAVATAFSMAVLNLIYAGLVYRKLSIVTLPYPLGGVLVGGK